MNPTPNSALNHLLPRQPHLLSASELRADLNNLAQKKQQVAHDKKQANVKKRKEANTDPDEFSYIYK